MLSPSHFIMNLEITFIKNLTSLIRIKVILNLPLFQSIFNIFFPFSILQFFLIPTKDYTFHKV